MSLALAAFLLLQEDRGLLDRGRRLLEERDLPAAERVFRELVSKSPEDSRASYYLGVALSRQDRTEEAVAAFENARRFAKAHQLRMPVYADGPEGLAKALDLGAVPLTLVLDRDGDVVYASTGSDDKAIDELRGVVQRLVSTKAIVSRTTEGETR